MKKDLLQFMCDTARKAGRLTIQYAEDAQKRAIEVKATEKDVVTFADKATEKYIIERLKAEYPDYNIFAEESGHDDHSTSDFLWVIDPIDGTTNYAAGIPHYSVSIGLWKAGKPYAGVVFSPVADKMYAAQIGSGATCNGKPIHVSDRKTLIESIVGVGFACLRANLPKNNLPAFCDMAPRVRGVRRYGSAALDLCMVAEGIFDGYWEYPLSLYDIGAGALILKEAGGVITDFDGGEEYPQKGILATNGNLHAAMQKIILEHDYR